MRDYELNPSSAFGSAKSSQNKRDYRYADSKYSQHKWTNYSGFKNEQDFYDFYTKNFYKKATPGGNSQSNESTNNQSGAKETWEKAKSARDKWYETYAKYQSENKEKSTGYNEESKSSYRKADDYSSQSSSQEHAKKDNEYQKHTNYKEYYRDTRNNYEYTNEGQQYYTDQSYEDYVKQNKKKSLFDKWKLHRKTEKDRKVYKEYKPNINSPFHSANRKIMINKLGKYTNFFRIVNLNKSPIEKMFSTLQAKFKLKTNLETINRGTIVWKDFKKMFPIKT